MGHYEQRKSRTENRILIADDDEFMRTLVKKGVSHMAQCFEVDTGEKVLAAYQEHLPNVVLLDIHMPVKKGFEVLSEILAFDSSAFIIMLSSDAVKDNVMRCVQHGAKGFIGKPFNHTSLIKYIMLCDTIHHSDATSVSIERPTSSDSHSC